MQEVNGNGNGNGFGEPAWFKTFKAGYASSQAFILHLNVQDYVVPGVRLPAYLAKMLASRDVIAFYDVARGISFPTESMENKAKKLLGLQAQANDVYAALGAASDAGMDWPKSPGSALPLLEQLLKSDAKVTVILEYADMLMPTQDIATMSPDDRRVLISLSRWGTDRIIKARGNIAFLITQNLADLHPMLRSSANCLKAIEIPLPDLTERTKFIQWYLDAWPLKLEMKADELARATAGLALVHIENIFLQADVQGALNRVLVRDMKTEIVETEYAGYLTIMDPSYGFAQVGGMEPLKKWARTEIIEPIRNGQATEVPQGVVLVGPPGTGKTFFVRALAAEIGFNAVSLDLEKILGGIVGESERRLTKALAAVRSLAPVLVFMDEIDQSDVSSRGNNSGNPVAKNLFSMMLRFLGDPSNRGKVIFFAASNRPDLIDPAMLRFGRMDAIIPIMLPSQEERKAIALAQAKSLGLPDKALGQQVAGMIAERTERYSAADVCAVIVKARKIARREGRTDSIIGADAMAALDCIRPGTVKQAQYFELLAVDACNDLELLPADRQVLLNNRDELVKEIEEAAPVPRRKREL